MTDAPQLYLVTPPEIGSDFPDRLAAILDVHPIACLRLDLATQDEDRVMRAADLTREVAHRFDVPLVVTDHVALVTRLGLDGVHLTDARAVGKLRRDWGQDPIIGAFCGTSRHEGMNAGEAGADYISFGPATDTGLGDGSHAESELFAWWSEMIELPVVAEGPFDDDALATLAALADFISLGEEVWSAEDPLARLGALIARMG